MRMEHTENALPILPRRLFGLITIAGRDGEAVSPVLRRVRNRQNRLHGFGFPVRLPQQKAAHLIGVSGLTGSGNLNKTIAG